MAGGGIKISNIKVNGGADGATFVPEIDQQGNLSWSNNKGYTNPQTVNIKGPKGENGKDGVDGAKLLSQELIGQDEQGGNIYKQTFSDGTEAYFTAPKGNDGVDGNGKGTTVTVGGVEQSIWNADTKLDLIEPSYNQTEFVMVEKDENGYRQVQMVGVFTPSTSYNSYVPVLRGLYGQVKGQTPPLENQTDLDLINRGELTEKLSDGLSGKVDKVTTAYKIYGTDGSGNQKAYQTGWSATSSLFQLMDQTPNGGYNDDGSFSSGATGTYMVAIPKKPSHATPKKWVEDNFTIYKHIVSFRVYDNMFIDGKFIVYSSQATPFTTKKLPNGVYVGWSGDGYNFLISNENGNMIATNLWGDVQIHRYLLNDDLFVDSDTVMKL